MTGRTQPPQCAAPAARRHGFSLIDLMVSMFVMGVLIAMLMPAVAHVRAAAQRTECRSNIRQQGLALQMFAYDHNAHLPQSVFSKEDKEFAYSPQQTIFLRIDDTLAADAGASVDPDWDLWDGLGILYHLDYLSTPEVFYCPSNAGYLDYPEFAPQYKSGAPGSIAGNYQYRLVASRAYLSDLRQSFTVISNATRSAREYSHRVGNNMLKSDMSVSWFADVGGHLLASLAGRDGTAIDRDGARKGVEAAWKMMDEGGKRITRTGGGSGGSSRPNDPHSNPNEGSTQYDDDD